MEKGFGKLLWRRAREARRVGRMEIQPALLYLLMEPRDGEHWRKHQTRWGRFVSLTMDF